MLKLFWNNFKKTNDCIILATPLILFLSALSWYYSYARDSIDNIPKLILAIATMLIMISGCLSAWVYMAKKTIRMSNKVYIFEKDRAKAFGELILSLPRGIGRLFLPMLGVISITLVAFSILILADTLLISKYIGTIDLSLLTTEKLALSSQELLNEINALPRQEILAINFWYLIFAIGTMIFSFFGILWIPEIVYAEKNPFKALYNSMKKIIITFPKTLGLFVYINILSIGISILNTLLMVNPISYFLVLIIYYYFLVYIVVLLFRYYEQTFIKSGTEN